jgi:hypothetical protein
MSKNKTPKLFDNSLRLFIPQPSDSNVNIGMDEPAITAVDDDDMTLDEFGDAMQREYVRPGDWIKYWELGHVGRKDMLRVAQVYEVNSDNKSGPLSLSTGYSFSSVCLIMRVKTKIPNEKMSQEWRILSSYRLVNGTLPDQERTPSMGNQLLAIAIKNLSSSNHTPEILFLAMAMM